MPKAEFPAGLSTLRPLWEQWNDAGGKDHPEVVRRQLETKTIADGAGSRALRQIDYFTFIQDAIRGTGGFLDGSYLFPHQREIIKQTSSLKPKALARIEMATYDNFAGVIAEAPWIQIRRAADMIKRDPANQDIDQFWNDVDGNRTAILDFLEFPFMQARSYGTGFVRMDRPPAMIRNETENRRVPVMLHSLPTASFKWWTLDAMGNLTGLIYCLSRQGYEAPAIYVWSVQEFAALLPTGPKEKEQYSVERWGTNPLIAEGRLPFARVHDSRPTYGEALGQSVMLSVAKIARDVYNTDSERMELRRNTAFPFLGLPMKTATAEAISKLEIGTASAVPYDGDGGEPKWVAPELQAMQELREESKNKKDQAFSMAHMVPFASYDDGKTVNTNSGYHAEMEADKTNTRIASCAASLEAFETELVDLWAMFRGVKFGEDRPTVEYPRDFGLRDMDKMFERTKLRLDMGLGDDDVLECLRDFYEALYPRTPEKEIEELAKAGVKAKAAAKKLEQQQMQTPRDRAKELIARGKKQVA